MGSGYFQRKMEITKICLQEISEPIKPNRNSNSLLFILSIRYTHLRVKVLTFLTIVIEHFISLISPIVAIATNKIRNFLANDHFKMTPQKWNSKRKKNAN